MIDWLLNPLHKYNPLRIFTLAAILITSMLVTVPTLAAPPDQQNGDQTGATIHVVQAGETLESIAERYGSTVYALKSANSMSGYDDIAVGQHLVVPLGQYERFHAPDETIVVNFGETLTEIAAATSASLDELARINHIVNPALIFSGQELRLPDDALNSPQQIIAPERSSIWRSAIASELSIQAILSQNQEYNPVMLPRHSLIRLPVDEPTHQVEAANILSVSLSPLPLERGRTAALHIEIDQAANIQVTFMGIDIPAASESANHYTALIPTDRFVAPGHYPLTVIVTTGDGISDTITRDVLVTEGNYSYEVINVTDEVYSVLTDQEAVDAELAYLDEAMTGYTPEKHWDGIFRLPAPGAFTSGFGTVRSYNGGSYDSYHSGADLAAPSGTPVYAPAAGVVVDAIILPVRGQVVIIDHGWGVYTGYWHQSNMLVEPGEFVTAGQRIGTVGSTGLSTAAHLHWEMRVNGVRVDPMQWVRYEFP
ncbi:MAG: peptidoglycan DD-metalloendopeptidase family protein [Anaerolineae bacterium]|nr:peptidoglycan DD-metalloendopeptidase family protein [Anaerolineae bacterium]